ncbi:hypothetical protein D3C81_1005400 [compost metagenome]
MFVDKHLPAFFVQANAIYIIDRVGTYKLIQIHPIYIPRRIRINPPLQPRRVIAESIVIKSRRVPLLARIPHGLVLGFCGRTGRETSRTTKRVIPFLADQVGVLVQLQRAGLQVVIEAVTHLVVGNVIRWIGNPMQHLHAVATGAGIGHVEDFTGAAMTADLHAGQVAYFADQRPGVGLV